MWMPRAALSITIPTARSTATRRKATWKTGWRSAMARNKWSGNFAAAATRAPAFRVYRGPIPVARDYRSALDRARDDDGILDLDRLADLERPARTQADDAADYAAKVAFDGVEYD